MCGISGVLGFKDNHDILKIIQQMNDLIIHRGPDAEGVYIDEQNKLAYGHRRLAIIDLSKDGEQPIQNDDGSLILIFNGEIYNYLELKEELIQKGYKFYTRTDSEVILVAYQEWGESCVNHFNGMWAFSLYDKANRLVLCSRDRFGIKPFYYSIINGAFFFGSEIKQLLAFHEKVVPNNVIIADFLTSGISDFDENTFFKGIKKLPASNNLIYDLKTDTFEIIPYFKIEQDQDVLRLDESGAIAEYTKLFEDAVKIRLRSDVTVGSCLSGGLDSSSVCAVAASLQGIKHQITAIHAKSTEPETDESYYAKIVAEAANLNLAVIEPSFQEFEAYLEEVIYTQEEPFAGPSVCMQYFVMKKANELGCKVMLDGQGGDETLLGYEKYYPAAYLDITKRQGGLQALKAIKNSNQNNHKMTYFWIAKSFLAMMSARARKKALRRRVSFLKKEYVSSMGYFDTLSKYFREDIFKLQAFEITCSNLPLLLRFEDKNSMRHSIETRLPFLDYRLLTLALSIESTHKIKAGWTKYILRKTIDLLLPKKLVWRKSKLGFNAPDSHWIDPRNEQMLSEVIRSKIIKKMCHMDILEKNFFSFTRGVRWRLYCLALWERIYKLEID